MGDAAFIIAVRGHISGVTETTAKKLGKCPLLLWRWIHEALKYQQTRNKFWPFVEKINTAKEREREAQNATVRSVRAELV